MDPNAGITVDKPSKYLSTDPLAGLDATAEEKPETPGFFSRLVHHPLDTITDELPTVGGVVGSLVGGAPGAAVGGGAGEGLKKLYNNARELPGALKDVVANKFEEEKAYASNLLKGKRTESPTSQGFVEGATEGAKDLGIQGAIQGATDVGGQLIGKGLKSVGKGLLKRAFVPDALELAKRPQLLEEIAAEGVNPTGQGIVTMDARTTAARKAAEKLVEDAAQPRVLPNGVKVTPKNIPPGEVVDALFHHPYSTPDQPLESVFEDISRRNVSGPAKEQLSAYVDATFREHPQGYDYLQALATKRREGKAAADVFKGTSDDPGFNKQVFAGVENGLRNALEKRVPGFAKANDVTEQKLRVLQTVRDAVTAHGAQRGKSIPAVTGALTVIQPLAGLTAFAAKKTLTHPAVEATLGRAALKAGSKPTVFSNAGRAAAAAIKESGKTSDAKRKAKVSKAKVDSLYKRYQQE